MWVRKLQGERALWKLGVGGKVIKWSYFTKVGFEYVD
jgi:hypothetical protein